MKNKKNIAREVFILICCLGIISLVYLSSFSYRYYQEYKSRKHLKMVGNIDLAINEMPGKDMLNFYNNVKERMYVWCRTGNGNYLVETQLFEEFKGNNGGYQVLQPEQLIVHGSSLPAGYTIYKSNSENYPETSFNNHPEINELDVIDDAQQTADQKLLEDFDSGNITLIDIHSIEESELVMISKIPYDTFAAKLQNHKYAEDVFNSSCYAGGRFEDFVAKIKTCKNYTVKVDATIDSLNSERPLYFQKADDCVRAIENNKTSQHYFAAFILLVAFPLRYLFLLFRWSHRELYDEQREPTQ